MNILKRMPSFHSFCESFGILFVFIFKFIAVKGHGLKQSLQKNTRSLKFQLTMNLKNPKVLSEITSKNCCLTQNDLYPRGLNSCCDQRIK
jgi:hypothetical protein